MPARPLSARESTGPRRTRRRCRPYLRNGDDDALRGVELEHKGLEHRGERRGWLSRRSADGGGDPVGAALWLEPLRAVANVVQVEATSFDVADRHDGQTGAGWADEVTDTTETAGAPQIERIVDPAARAVGPMLNGVARDGWTTRAVRCRGLADGGGRICGTSCTIRGRCP